MALVDGGVCATLGAVCMFIFAWRADAQSKVSNLAKLREPLPFSFSAAPQGEDVVVTYYDEGRLAVFSADGALKRSYSAPGVGRLEFNEPEQLTRRADGGYFLLEGASHLLWLDRTLKPVDGWLMPDKGVTANPSLTSFRGGVDEIFVWQAVSTSDRVVFEGDVRDAKGWRSGVFQIARRLPLVLETLDLRADFSGARPEANRWFLYGVHLRPLLAAVGGDVFQVRVAESISVERLAPHPQTIPLPGGVETATPRPPVLGAREDVPALWSFFESHAIPVALFEWRGHLHLLTRGGDKGARVFRLWRLKASGGWSGPAELRFGRDVHEIVAVPGDEALTVLAKGARTAPEVQPTLGMHRFSAQELESSFQ